jgi:hypothetical protein
MTIFIILYIQINHVSAVFLIDNIKKKISNFIIIIAIIAIIILTITKDLLLNVGTHNFNVRVYFEFK